MVCGRGYRDFLFPVQGAGDFAVRSGNGGVFYNVPSHPADTGKKVQAVFNGLFDKRELAFFDSYW